MDDLEVQAAVEHNATAIDLADDVNEEGSEEGYQGEPSPSEAAADASGAPLSKNQQKKLARLARIQEMKVKRKAAEKAAKAEKKAKIQADRANLTEEERQKLREQAMVRGAERKQQKQDKNAKLKECVVSGQKVVIDLDFNDYMVEQDMRHICHQLSYAYSSNSRVDKPCHLHLLGLNGKIKELAAKLVAGLDKWYVTTSEQGWADFFPDQKDRLVYLSADSETELQELDPNDIYIIGGLVDHNKHKGLCYRRAQAGGIRTARLPITKHMELESSTVLAVNHVVAIMAEQVNRRDWGAVLQDVLPHRKRKVLPASPSPAPAVPAAPGASEPAVDAAEAETAAATAAAEDPAAGAGSGEGQAAAESGQAGDGGAEVAAAASGEPAAKRVCA